MSERSNNLRDLSEQLHHASRNTEDSNVIYLLWRAGEEVYEFAHLVEDHEELKKKYYRQSKTIKEALEILRRSNE